MFNLISVVPVGDFDLLTKDEVIAAAGPGAGAIQLEEAFAKRLQASAMMRLYNIVGYVPFNANIVERSPCWFPRMDLQGSELMDGRTPDATTVGNIVLKYHGEASEVTSTAFKVDYTDTSVAVIPSADLQEQRLDADFKNPIGISYSFTPGTFNNQALLAQAMKLLVRAEFDAEEGDGDRSGAYQTAMNMLSEYSRALVG